MTVEVPESVSERLGRIRDAMQSRHIDAIVVLSSDPHLSEYLPEHWQFRQWLSGFHGSAGTLVITATFAGLWVDSRYWEQADQQLQASPITPMYAGMPEVVAPIQWVANHLQAGQTVWSDFSVLPYKTYQEWEGVLTPHGIHLRGEESWMGALWADRPALPAASVYAHEPPHACRTIAENVQAVRKAMAEQQAQWHVLSSLDDIAWLLNLRGSDIPYNPVFLAYVLLGEQSITLFVDAHKLSTELTAHLTQQGVVLRGYDDVYPAISALPTDSCVLIDGARTTQAMRQQLQPRRIVDTLNPSQLLKACKTDAELAHVRATMVKDGVALCEFFAWFEAAIASETITELTVDEKLTAARARQAGFVSPSFGTIAAFNANGAMPHYSATPEQHAVIEGNGLLLIDSGGQYLGGTTDITRVIPVGTVSVEQQQGFTRVLQGMIALSQAHFPVGTPGVALDAIARLPLWRHGLDFGHGTGHGVGYFMNVHEGPQSISPRVPTPAHVGLQAGMITSNEPGLYRPGQWGVRIENLVAAIPASTSAFGEFLKFETLTLCPIDTRCIVLDALSIAEKQWLNAYHARVYRKLQPHVDGAALAWLQERTQAI